METSNTIPLVSIIIPCYNYGRYVEEAVDSALNQTYQNIEVIVVNDASTDPQTISILDELQKTKPIRLIQHETNQGVSATRNTAIAASFGKYILPLDADDTIEPTIVEKTTKVLEKMADVGFVSVGMHFFGDVDEIRIPPTFDFDTLLYHNIVTVTSLFRKSAWEEVGGYNEGLIHGYEDWEFWISLAKNGWRGHVVEEALFNYRKHGKSMIDDSVKKHAYIISQILVIHPELYYPTSSPKLYSLDPKNVEKNKKPSRTISFRNSYK